MGLYIGKEKYKPMLGERKASFLTKPKIKPIQLIQNGDFSDSTNGWTFTYSQSSVDNNILTLVRNTGLGSAGSFAKQNVSPSTSHLYYMRCMAKKKDDNIECEVGMYFINNNSQSGNTYVGSGSTDWVCLEQVTSPKSNSNLFCIRVGYSATPLGAEGYFKNVILIDLTSTFGQEKEPTLEQCRQIFIDDYYQYYNPS